MIFKKHTPCAPCILRALRVPGNPCLFLPPRLRVSARVHPDSLYPEKRRGAERIIGVLLPTGSVGGRGFGVCSLTRRTRRRHGGCGERRALKKHTPCAPCILRVLRVPKSSFRFLPPRLRVSARINPDSLCPQRRRGAERTIGVPLPTGSVGGRGFGVCSLTRRTRRRHGGRGERRALKKHTPCAPCVLRVLRGPESPFRFLPPRLRVPVGGHQAAWRVFPWSSWSSPS